MDARKADTRNKIQLGGLIVKAGLAEEPAAVLLGLLLEASRNAFRPRCRDCPAPLAQSGRSCTFYLR